MQIKDHLALQLKKERKKTQQIYDQPMPRNLPVVRLHGIDSSQHYQAG